MTVKKIICPFRWSVIVRLLGGASVKTWLYFSFTIFSAALSMLRGLIVASTANEIDFARYAVVLSTGYFIGYLLSFGSIESSFKSFPRLIVSGRIDEVHRVASAVFGKLSVRGVFLACVFFFLGFASGFNLFFDISVAVLFAMVASITSLVASVQRASGDYGGLGTASFVRSVLSLALVGAAAFLYDIRWAIAAELAAGALGVFVSSSLAGLRLHGFANWRSVVSEASDGVFRGVMSNRGLLVSLSAVFVAIPFYLDRMFVLAVFDSVDAARYALLALFLGAAVLLFNAITQRVGAEAIKLVATTRSASAAVDYVWRWACGGIVIWLGFIIAVGFAFYSGLLPSGLGKYEVDVVLLLPAAVLGSLYVTAVVEFLLLALDGERKIFICSSMYLATILLSALFVWFDRPSLQLLIWLMAAARAAYLLFLCIGLVRLGGGNMRGAQPPSPSEVPG